MEDGLRPSPKSLNGKPICLNPCCNGRWSLAICFHIGERLYSLNPCCNGRWSLARLPSGKNIHDCLNPCCNGRWSLASSIQEGVDNNFLCLNPCCNGRWSLADAYVTTISSFIVLILVVMEDGLRLPHVPNYLAGVS